MFDIVYESMNIRGKDADGNYQVILLGEVDGGCGIMPMLITPDLMCLEGRDNVLADLFKEHALRLMKQGVVEKDNI